ncbi:MAG: GNAT family N-acetyltransferase, partial [Candidatus Heimdallarchaeota archaeon]
ILFEKLITQKITTYNSKRDRNNILRLEVQRFSDPMNGTLLNYLVSKYGTEYFEVVDISGNHQLDGYIMAGIERSDKLYIFSIAIEEKYEKQGWGSKLLDRVISKAKVNGITHFSLHVKISNYRAQNLYRKFGFVESTLVKDYYGPGKNGFIMEL